VAAEFTDANGNLKQGLTKPGFVSMPNIIVDMP
jgi:hypothetical protein